MLQLTDINDIIIICGTSNYIIPTQNRVNTLIFISPKLMKVLKRYLCRDKFNNINIIFMHA